MTILFLVFQLFCLDLKIIQDCQLLSRALCTSYNSYFLRETTNGIYLSNFNELIGRERALKKTIPSLVGCLFNIILHLESPNIFCISEMPFSKANSYPDAGAVVLMCVEVLTTVVGRHSCPMDASHVSQCLHIPTTLFRNFNQMKKLVENGFTIDRQHFIDLYAACCKLICAVLKHRIR